MPHTVPRRVARTSQYIAVVSSPAAPVVLALWGANVWDPGRPHLALMSFIMSLSVTGFAAVVWALAACHLAIAKAFAVGVSVGQAAQRPAPSPGQPVSLRAVE